MARIPWRGKTANHLTVGPSKLFDYTTVQAALDAIETAGDNARLNRYAITVAPGIYSSESAVVHNRAFVDVAAEVAGTAVFVRDNATNGGTMRLGDSGEGNYDELVEDVYLWGLRLVRDNVGTAKTAPESALFVGDEKVLPSAVPWDRITIQSCFFEGGHDALQFFGVDDGPLEFISGTPPRCNFLQNIIRCQHDAVTLKGGAQLYSSGNVVQVNPNVSTISPYLQNEEQPWKQTGFHYNSNRPDSTARQPINPESWYWSVSDTLVIEGNIGQADTANSQAIAGFLFYDQGNGADQRLPRVRIVNPAVYMRVRDDGNQTGNVPIVGGIVLSGAEMDNAGGEDFVVAGGSIYVDQQGDTVATPADTYGIRVDGGHSSGTLTVRVLGTDITVKTAKSGGSPYSLSCGAADAIEKLNVASDQAADPANAGSIAELTPVANN